MNEITVERQRLIETVSSLPDESLNELAHFLDYLRYKTSRLQKSEPQEQQQESAAPTNFLSAITGLGTSGQTHISEQDEIILVQEIDSIHGWSAKLNDAP